MHIIPQNKDCTVLIVDDSPFMRNMLRTMLEKLGFNVVAEAADGDEAIIEYSKKHPLIIFMDILMPRKSGIDATKEILSSNKNAKVVMCSSLGHVALIEAALESGARDVIFKPYKIDQLQEVLRKIMQF
jgi:two-component system chemotaxis response regulator CheY